ncbi:hypothetical protein KSC_031560 [Ktedonobacter sp. SOSP1-52]|nr:hypothetical protein KSC_031560 [Ktedonobacter sp. SOSP1-52]
MSGRLTIMKTQASAPVYKGFRFPVDIIGHCIWLYFRFSLSFRDIEELMVQRGIVLTYETIRHRCVNLSRRKQKDPGQSHLNNLINKKQGKGEIQ